MRDEGRTPWRDGDVRELGRRGRSKQYYDSRRTKTAGERNIQHASSEDGTHGWGGNARGERNRTVLERRPWGEEGGLGKIEEELEPGHPRSGVNIWGKSSIEGVLNSNIAS